MYQLSIKEEFVAQHFLTVPDCGPENVNHSHIYAVELLIEGKKLNKYGYLVDIDEVKKSMADAMGMYRDKTLNETPAFQGLNPSIEHFARILVEHFVASLNGSDLDTLTVRMWEDRYCWASYSVNI
ncbi:MAG: 6-carboxytetrahydropterin synthase [Rhodothermaceae bacterium]|nr:6-carboxytetrahydropterin synthase [Rhodothermaceae bacterium]